MKLALRIAFSSRERAYAPLNYLLLLFDSRSLHY